MRTAGFGLALIAVIAVSKLSALPPRGLDPWGGLRLQQSPIPDSKKQNPFKIETEAIRSVQSAATSGAVTPPFTMQQLISKFPPFTKHPVEHNFDPGVTLTSLEHLGMDLLFDYTLSFNANDPDGDQDGDYSCLMCHKPEMGWSNQSSDVNKYLGPVPGAIKGRYGKRKPPGLAYNVFSPSGPKILTIKGETKPIGGLFWDGRAPDPQHQPRMPFLDVNEMNEPIDNGVFPPFAGGYSSDVVTKAMHREDRFKTVFATQLSQHPTANQKYQMICDAIAAFELSKAVNRFNSDFDKNNLSDSAKRGRALFFGKAQCSECHSSADLDQSTLVAQARGKEIFTMFCFVNTGIPKNVGNPFYVQTDSQSNPRGYNPEGVNFLDPGLAGNPNPGPNGDTFFGKLEYRGLFKAPTLRNVDKRPSSDFVRAYFHNGFAKSLSDVVFFYNFRNVAKNANGNTFAFDLRIGPPAGYTRMVDPPETLANIVNVAGNSPSNAGTTDETNGEIGNLQLSSSERNDLVSFLKALTDH